MTGSSRRAILGGGAVLALAGCAAPMAGTGTSETLKSAAAAHGRRFGSAFAWGAGGSDTGSFANPAYAGLLRRDCAILVPENEMKWQAIRPSADAYALDHFDAMVDYAERQGFALRGHTLLWHRPKWFPGWLNAHDFGARPATEAARILTGHIDTLTRRYAGKIASYDVVNEAVDPETGALVETVLSKAMGGVEPLLDLAFHTASADAPGTQLVYNDYMSWEPGNENHRAGVLRLLAGFRKRGVPVDALGIQSHIEMKTLDPATGIGPYQGAAWRQFLNEVTGMGYDLVVTEFDVRDNALPGDIAVRDQGVADYTRVYFETMLDFPQLRDILAWGMTSRYSWLQGFDPRADGLPQRCCPYDDRFRPLPMRAALIGLLRLAQAT